jgi:hypothetical protein
VISPILANVYLHYVFDPPRCVEMTRLMHGFPPSADGQVTLANWRQAPFSRWAFHHVRELVPSSALSESSSVVGDGLNGGERLRSRGRGAIAVRVLARSANS